MCRINYHHDNTPAVEGGFGGAMCMCNKCQNGRDRDAELVKRTVSVIASVDDAKRFLAAGHPNTAAEWLVTEVERLTAANHRMESERDEAQYITSTLRGEMEQIQALYQAVAGDAGHLLYRATKSETEVERLKKFTQWCVDNWQCDRADEAYTEDFCGSPQCRRCSAKRALAETV